MTDKPTPGSAAGCTCGEPWKGHPEPHAATCPQFNMLAAPADATDLDATREVEPDA